MRFILRQRYVGFVFLLILGSSMNLYASTNHSPQITQLRDVGANIEDSKNWTYKFIFPNKETVSIKNDGSPYTFLMVDGEVLPNLNLPIINNRSFIPLRLLGEALDMDVDWDSSTKTALISKGETSVFVPAIKNGSEVQLINNSIYVSIRFLSENFPLRVAYYPFDTTGNNPFVILRHPFVTVDSNTFVPKFTKKQGMEIVKSELLKAYDNFLKNKNYNTQSEESIRTLNRLKEDINNLSYMDTISKFYTFKGPYPVLFDNITGKIYFLQELINKSYIHEIDVTVPDIFAYSYFVG